MELTRFTWHGGGLAAARAQFGDGAWLDLSTGINPCPWPHAAALPVDWQALPDEAALRDLERAAAAHFGCAAEHVCAVPGTEIGLRLVGALLTGDLPGGGGFHAAPAYRTHGDMLRGSVAVDDPLAAPAGHLVLANPNNPDGRLLTPAMLQAMLHQRGEGGWLLLDEAFADTHPAQSLAGLVTTGLVGALGDNALVIVGPGFAPIAQLIALGSLIVFAWYAYRWTRIEAEKVP